jgi:hypothetical protein
VFFISYVLFEVPSNMLLTRVRPSFYLSALCVIWGGIAAAMGACQTWQQVAGVRFALGVAEAGFAVSLAIRAPGPGSLLSRSPVLLSTSLLGTDDTSWLAAMLSTTLPRLSLAHFPVSLPASSSSTSTLATDSRGGAGFSSSKVSDLAVSASSLGVRPRLVTFKPLTSCARAVFLPDWPATTKWLTDEERLIMQQRLAADNLGSTQDEGEHTQTHLQAIGSCFKEWRVLALSLLYMLATGSQTIQYFIPALVGQLGYTGFYLQVGFRSDPLNFADVATST